MPLEVENYSLIQAADKGMVKAKLWDNSVSKVSASHSDTYMQKDVSQMETVMVKAAWTNV